MRTTGKTRKGATEREEGLPAGIREPRQINELTLAKTLEIALATVNVVNYGI